MTANPVHHARSKHIEIDYHFVREKVVKGDIIVQYIPTSEQLADIFTKGLPSAQFHYLRSNLRILPPCSDWGGVLVYLGYTVNCVVCISPRA